MRLGTRGSALACWQAEHVAGELQSHGQSVEIVTIETKGDKILDVPLAEIGDKGLFTQELDAALLSGDIQLAVHSLKDLPTSLPRGLELAAVLSRTDPSDAFVAHPDFRGSLADLPDGATIGTSSLRRQAQLLAWRPDLQIVPVRGNVPTRIAKLDTTDLRTGGWHGLILATAGLMRLSLEDRITERINHDVMLPAVSQGALGVVTAGGDQAATDLIRKLLDDPEVRATVTAERALLRRLEGGCQVPVAGHATLEGDMLHLSGSVVSLDGREFVRSAVSGPVANADDLGRRLADELLAGGAGRILEAIRLAE